MSIITIENDDQKIVSTNYWMSEYSRAGKIYCSINARAFRLLIPPRLESAILKEMRTGRYCIITRGEHRQFRREMTEFLFEDGSETPFSIHLSIEQTDRLLPASDAMRSDLTLTAWVPDYAGKPSCALAMPAKLRIAPLPCLKPWPEGGANDGH
jgi:hypothetical protein